MKIENITLGSGHGFVNRFSWSTELTLVDGEIQAVNTRSYKGYYPSLHIHYLVHYPHMPLMCLTSFKGPVSHGHWINPETGIQTEYHWNKRKEV